MSYSHCLNILTQVRCSLLTTIPPWAAWTQTSATTWAQCRVIWVFWRSLLRWLMCSRPLGRSSALEPPTPPWLPWRLTTGRRTTARPLVLEKVVEPPIPPLHKVSLTLMTLFYQQKRILDLLSKTTVWIRPHYTKILLDWVDGLCVMAFYEALIFEIFSWHNKLGLTPY